MEEENTGIEVVVANTEIGKSGELIKKLMINIPEDLASNADVLIIGVNVNGYTIDASSVFAMLLNIDGLKGAVLGYEKDK